LLFCSELRSDLAWANAGRAAALFNVGRRREAGLLASEAVRVLMVEIERTGRHELRQALGLALRIVALASS
jgi:hypothetical protein